MTEISQYWPFLKIIHILDAYLAQMTWYISVYMPIHYLSKYFNSENKSFIEFTPFGYQAGNFRDTGCFGLSKVTKNPGGSDSKIDILFTYTALDSSCCVQYIYYRGNCTFK